MKLRIQVPEGVGAGDKISVTVSGHKYHVRVPDGAEAGAILTVRLPGPAEAAAPGDGVEHGEEVAEIMDRVIKLLDMAMHEGGVKLVELEEAAADARRVVDRQRASAGQEEVANTMQLILKQLEAEIQKDRNKLANKKPSTRTWSCRNTLPVRSE